MKISVAVITYNQQDTIAQTLDSILCQQGDFELEVVVGEDCSTDNTWAICKEYAERYPEQVVLLENTHNLGITANFARVMKACTGELVSVIAGDDYYYSDKALDIQSKYLLAHPEYGVMCANGYRYYVKRDKMVPGIPPLNPIEDGNVKPIFFGEKYFGGVYMTPVGSMYRRELLQKIDFDEFVRRGFPAEDDPMQAILSQYTRFAKLPDLLVVYRVYRESSTFVMLDNPKYLEYHKGLMRVRKYLNELFPNDIVVDDDWMDDYIFYKEFLLYVHQRDYKKARDLVRSRHYQSRNLKQAQRFTKSWLHFIVFHLYKEYTYYKELKQRT